MKSFFACRWEPAAAGARILRVYGDDPCPIVPSEIAGRPLVAVGGYCFSAKELPGGFYFPADAPAEAFAHAVCGSFVTSATLPESVQVLESGAFYNCRHLETLSLGSGIFSLGSDLFTNCGLHSFVLRASPDCPTGLRKLLGTVGTDITIRFFSGNTECARLFYPEYSEFLDENTPAHIFNHSIEGEGYRYRQCFDGDTLSFPEYDRTFSRAATSETPEKLCRIALCRLLFPAKLAAEAQTKYSDYLTTHTAAAAKLCIALRDTEALRYLCRSMAVGDAAKAACACARLGWSEGSALILSSTARRTAKRYSF
jgi:hypothetical protein